jgi:hypothetical protein
MGGKQLTFRKRPGTALARIMFIVCLVSAVARSADHLASGIGCTAETKGHRTAKGALVAPMPNQVNKRLRPSLR